MWVYWLWGVCDFLILVVLRSWVGLVDLVLGSVDCGGYRLVGSLCPWGLVFGFLGLCLVGFCEFELVVWGWLVLVIVVPFCTCGFRAFACWGFCFLCALLWLFVVFDCVFAFWIWVCGFWYL